jgi:hypothetical protein
MELTFSRYIFWDCRRLAQQTATEADFAGHRRAKISRPISRVNVEPKINVSEISSVSIIRVAVMNDRTLLIFIPVCQIDAYWCIMQWEGGVKRCGYPSDCNLSRCYLTWCTYYQIFFFACSSVVSWDFRVECVFEYLKTWCWDSMFC